MPLLLEAIVDSSLLLALMLPPLYLFLLQPFRAHISTLEEAYHALERSRADLEDRVRERTSELSRSDRELKDSLLSLERIHREHVLLGELAEMLQVCRTTEEASRILCSYGQRQFPGLSGALYAYRASRNLLEPLASWGAGVGGPSGFAPDHCWALRRGKTHTTCAENSRSDCLHLQKFPQSGNHLCIPMMAQGEAIGVFVLSANQSGTAAGQIPEETIRLAELGAEQIGLAMANIQLRDKLQNLAIRDPLTGLFNRRYFEETADRELHRAKCSGLPIAFAVIDIDHFKRFNDTMGHEAGDVVLKRVGQLLQGLMSVEDVACRLGGEEFVLLMFGTDSEVQSRVDNVHIAVKELECVHHDQVLSNITISIGVAVSTLRSDETVGSLLDAADRSLYRAKREGRDRIVWASTTPLPEPSLAQ